MAVPASDRECKFVVEGLVYRAEVVFTPRVKTHAMVNVNQHHALYGFCSESISGEGFVENCDSGRSGTDSHLD